MLLKTISKLISYAFHRYFIQCMKPSINGNDVVSSVRSLLQKYADTKYRIMDLSVRLAFSYRGICLMRTHSASLRGC